QAAAIEGADVDFDRESVVGARTPVDRDHAFRMRGLKAAQIGAVAAMDADAAAERDVAADRFRRHGSAAAREAGQQVADALDGHAGLARRHRRLAHDWGRQLLRFGAPLDCAADLRRVDLAFADRLVQRIGARHVELADELGERHAVYREALQLTLENLPALLAIVLFVELAEPGAHLAAIAGRGEISKRGNQPVAARIGLLGRDDLDLIAVGERLIERNHPPVDLRAAAAMAEIGVHVVGVIERRGAARQIYDFAARGERIYAVLENLRAHALEEVALCFRFTLA